MDGLKTKTLLMRRCTRWSFEDQAGAIEAGLASLKRIRSQMPPCFIFAVIGSWLNGWAVFRRMQIIAPCVLCSLEASEDSIEHYSSCHVVRAAAESIFSLQLGRDLKHFLIFEPMSLDAACAQAAMLYATRKAAAIRRGKRRVHGVAEHQAHQKLP